MLRGSVTASLIGYVLLMHVKEFGQLLIGMCSLLEKISRGLYYERIPLYSRVHHLLLRLNSGGDIKRVRTSLEDEAKSGRPMYATTKKSDIKFGIWYTLLGEFR